MIVRRFRGVLLVLLLVLTVLPAAAAERVDALPAIKSFNAARFEGAFVINDQLFIAAEGQMASPERIYFTLRTVPNDVLPETTLEVVIYDGTVYTRQDDDPQWYIEDIDVGVAPPTTPAPAPGQDISLGEEVPITYMGTTTVAGAETDQYQIWLADLDSDGNPQDYGKIDLFIGKAVNYLNQFQLSLFDQDPELGEMKAELVLRFYDFEDETISVGVPANAIPREDVASLGLFEVRGYGMLDAFAAPLALPQMREFALRGLNR